MTEYCDVSRARKRIWNLDRIADGVVAVGAIIFSLYVLAAFWRKW